MFQSFNSLMIAIMVAQVNSSRFVYLLSVVWQAVVWVDGYQHVADVRLKKRQWTKCESLRQFDSFPVHTAHSIRTPSRRRSGSRSIANKNTRRTSNSPTSAYVDFVHFEPGFENVEDAVIGDDVQLRQVVHRFWRPPVAVVARQRSWRGGGGAAHRRRRRRPLWTLVRPHQYSSSYNCGVTGKYLSKKST